MPSPRSHPRPCRRQRRSRCASPRRPLPSPEAKGRESRKSGKGKAGWAGWENSFPFPPLLPLPSLRSPERLVEEIDGALPGELGGGFAVTWRRVVVEAVLRVLVREDLVLLVVGLERRFEGRNPLVHAVIVARVVQHQRRADLRHVPSAGLPAVEGRAR